MGCQSNNPINVLLNMDLISVLNVDPNCLGSLHEDAWNIEKMEPALLFWMYTE